MTAEFDAVLRGERSRARWRSPHGWVRAQRLSDHHLSLRGPRAEVVRLSAQAGAAWDPLPTCGALAPGTADDAPFEVLLIRTPAVVAPPRKPGTRLRVFPLKPAPWRPA